MKALLLGFGDLARRLAPRLCAQGWQVTGVRRSAATFAGVTMVRGNCRDGALLDRLLVGQDLVVVSLTPGAFTEQAYRETYVESAQAIADAVGRQVAAPRCLLWVSSTSVYGQNDGAWVDESSPAQPSGFSGRCLLAAEDSLRQASPTSTIVRFSGIYGPGRSRLIEQVQRGQCAASEPPQWTNRIHRDDCAAVLHHLASLAMSGTALAPCYIGSDCEPVPLHLVHQWLAQKLGVTVSPVAPDATMRSNRRCSNKLLLASGYEFIYPTFREGYGGMI